MLEVFDDISEKIRCANDDGFCVFWNVENKEPIGQREENPGRIIHFACYAFAYLSNFLLHIAFRLFIYASFSSRSTPQ